MEQHDAEESMAIRKILAYDIRMKKNPQTKDETFWINTDMESHDAENSMAIRKILAHDIRMKKNIHKPRSRLSGLRIFMELCGPKVQLAREFHQWRR